MTLTAKQAREIAKKARLADDGIITKVINQILSEIKDAAKTGKYSMSFYIPTEYNRWDNVRSEVVAKLTRMGFEFTDHQGGMGDPREYDWTEISWW